MPAILAESFVPFTKIAVIKVIIIIAGKFIEIGTPAICAYRGGMTELLTNYVNGFTYDFIEHPMLALRIMEIFENDELAVSFSKKSIELAEIRHDKVKNVEELLATYNNVLKR